MNKVGVMFAVVVGGKDTDQIFAPVLPHFTALSLLCAALLLPFSGLESCATLFPPPAIFISLLLLSSAEKAPFWKAKASFSFSSCLYALLSFFFNAESRGSTPNVSFRNGKVRGRASLLLLVVPQPRPGLGMGDIFGVSIHH